MESHEGLDINIFLHLPCLTTKRIRVRSSLNVGHLSRTFPGADVAFYFKGFVLEPLNTFTFYDIRDDDNIFAVRRAERGGPSAESYRISDLRLMGLGQMSRRMLSQFMEGCLSGEQSEDRVTCDLICYDARHSRLPLPVFWEPLSKESVLTK